MDGLYVFLNCICTIFLFQGLHVAFSSKSPKKYTLLENENLLVRCNVTKHPDIYVYWSKNDTKHYFRQNGTDLTISNIKRNYSGDYICHALNTSYPIYNETNANVTINIITVDVQYPGEVDDMGLSPHTVLEKQTFTVSCSFQGNPDPTWSIRNRDTGQALVKVNGAAAGVSTGEYAPCDSAGFWECTGYNRLNKGVNATKGYNLTVFCSPRPIFDQKVLFETVLGADAKIDVNILSYPSPNYTWVRSDGSPVTGGIQTDDDHSTELEFQNVQISQLGDYNLTMSNKYGTHHSKYTLAVNGPPQTPTNLNYSDVTYDSVTLRWMSGFNMGSQQYFMVMKWDGNAFSRLSQRIYDNSTNNGVNVTWTYTYRRLASSTFYNISIVSENTNRFLSGISNPVHFYTQPYPTAPPHTSHTHMGLILGLTLGTVAIIGTLACLVYIFKWKHMKTSYAKQ